MGRKSHATELPKGMIFARFVAASLASEVLACWAGACDTGGMRREPEVDATIAAAVARLVDSGARLVYLHGSRAAGTARPHSDIDLAAWFDARNAPYAHDIDLPDDVDLLVLDRAPLEMAGRVALRGKLLHAADTNERIHWEAMTRKIYSDELPRITRAHNEFLTAVTARD